MRKFGGIVLIIVGVVFIGVAVMRAFEVLVIFLNEETSAYGVGFMTGTAVLLILLSFLGIKAFKRGCTLL